jgi:molybdopterin synthase sulfur carrier subunit
MLKVLYFARLRDQLGQSQEELAIELPATVEQVVQHLSLRGDHWHKQLTASNILTAINQQLCQSDSVLHVGDELAFFPPVTGG